MAPITRLNTCIPPLRTEYRTYVCMYVRVHVDVHELGICVVRHGRIQLKAFFLVFLKLFLAVLYRRAGIFHGALSSWMGLPSFLPAFLIK